MIDAFNRLLVERLNILQNVPERDDPGTNLPCSEPIKHVGVIGIGAVGADEFGRIRAHRTTS
jgi:hypothetical protein